MLVPSFNAVHAAVLQGFSFELLVVAESVGNGKCKLGFFIRHSFSMPLAATLQLCAQEAGSGKAYTYGCMRGSTLLGNDEYLHGSANFFTNGDATVSSIGELSRFVIDGHLKLRATFYELDGRKLQ